MEGPGSEGPASSSLHGGPGPVVSHGQHLPPVAQEVLRLVSRRLCVLRSQVLPEKRDMEGATDDPDPGSFAETSRERELWEQMCR